MGQNVIIDCQHPVCPLAVVSSGGCNLSCGPFMNEHREGRSLRIWSVSQHAKAVVSGPGDTHVHHWPHSAIHPTFKKKREPEGFKSTPSQTAQVQNILV